MSWSCKIFICNLWMALQFETHLNNIAHMSNVCVIWHNLHAFTWVWDTVRYICIVLQIIHISRSNITRNPYISNNDNEHNMKDETLFSLSTQKDHIICPYGGLCDVFSGILGEKIPRDMGSPLYYGLPGKQRWAPVPPYLHLYRHGPRHRTRLKTVPLCYLSELTRRLSIWNAIARYWRQEYLKKNTLTRLHLLMTRVRETKHCTINCMNFARFPVWGSYSDMVLWNSIYIWYIDFQSSSAFKLHIKDSSLFCIAGGNRLNNGSPPTLGKNVERLHAHI